MNWLKRLFSKQVPSDAGSVSRSLSGKRVALAVVDNPKGSIIMDMSGGDTGGAGGVTPKMIHDFIKQDLSRYPHLRAKAAAIQEIVILSDEHVSSGNYAQDMTQCYLKHMRSGGWAEPESLHIFEILLADVTVYIAYAT
ncbi:MAG TPA: hypothetical protein PLI09_02240 [Candidatus Hydrogenedentes bacterium]|nr:hypothetical protein [Candidatus Hydrogenedentota bacterium]